MFATLLQIKLFKTRQHGPCEITSAFCYTIHFLTGNSSPPKPEHPTKGARQERKQQGNTTGTPQAGKSKASKPFPRFFRLAARASSKHQIQRRVRHISTPDTHTAGIAAPQVFFSPSLPAASTCRWTGNPAHRKRQEIQGQDPRPAIGRVSPPRELDPLRLSGLCWLAEQSNRTRPDLRPPAGSGDEGARWAAGIGGVEA